MTLDAFSLDGKVALITGASRGLGAGMAAAMSAAGASVALHSNERPATETAERICRESGRRTELFTADLEDRAAADRLVADTITAFGQIDILVNNAGVSWGAEPQSMPLDKWQNVLDINLTGAFLCAQAVGREMLKRQYGRIINVASIAGLQASVHGAHYAGYAASKAGLMGLTRELAASWGRSGIRVNAIAPGFFHSRLADPAIVHAEPHIKATSPIPRVGEAGELKAVAVFLAADASNYITGQTIVVDGGRTISG
jgi:NAD(P)-dependent dehydrogenase (short-subunit alcohol dehydrogenase family)